MGGWESEYQHLKNDIVQPCATLVIRIPCAVTNPYLVVYGGCHWNSQVQLHPPWMANPHLKIPTVPPMDVAAAAVDGAMQHHAGGLPCAGIQWHHGCLQRVGMAVALAMQWDPTTHCVDHG